MVVAGNKEAFIQQWSPQKVAYDDECHRFDFMHIIAMIECMGNWPSNRGW